MRTRLLLSLSLLLGASAAHAVTLRENCRGAKVICYGASGAGEYVFNKDASVVREYHVGKTREFIEKYKVEWRTDTPYSEGVRMFYAEGGKILSAPNNPCEFKD